MLYVCFVLLLCVVVMFVRGSSLLVVVRCCLLLLVVDCGCCRCPVFGVSCLLLVDIGLRGGCGLLLCVLFVVRCRCCVMFALLPWVVGCCA